MLPGEKEERDGLMYGPARQRGAGINPGNRFEKVRLHVLGEERERQRQEKLASGEPDVPHRVPLQVIADHTKTIINRVAATPDVPFDWTVNPYRGCEHGCIYCFARPYHEYLGYSCGLDFETKIVAKHDAASLLKRELASPKWCAEPIVMSAITDIYQPLEQRLGLARQCLQVMADCGQAVSTMTKGALVLRDVDLWQKLGAMNAGRVTITFVTLDDSLAKRLEPRAASPSRRLAVLRELTRAGVPTHVNVAPIILGLTGSEMPAILQAIADAGCTRVSWMLLRLPYQVKDLFLEWLGRNVHRSRAAYIESLVRQTRGGKLYAAKLGVRGRGTGQIAEHISRTFDIFCRKYGLNRDVRPLNTRAFRRPSLDKQLALFA